MRRNDKMAAGNNLILLDGGMGHELKNRGISDGSFLAGVLANEDTIGGGAAVVESIHFDFLEAGCDVITTNSFVAVPPRMIECGLASDEASANTRSAQLISAAIDRAKAAIVKYNKEHQHERDTYNPKRIAGCIPPLTECYFADKVPPLAASMISSYKTIMSTLIDKGADVLLAETLSTLREADAILKALASIQDVLPKNTIPPLWISFTIHDDKPLQLRSGEFLVAVCQSILKLADVYNVSVEAIGVNCSAPFAISSALDVLSKELDGTSINLICYGNCFQTTTSEWIRSLNNDNNSTSATPNQSCCDEYDGNRYMLPDAYARYANAWAMTGAAIVGGCCGCGHLHMRAVASTMR
jgi:S-methylmethionine-dependent homocysteine/selenocysteine methylase